MLKSAFSIIKWDAGAIWISDNNVGMSITNDAENVCDYMHINYPGRRIFYRDTMGNWDELVHFCGQFTEFRPLTDAEAKSCPEVKE